jgi:hypothetical protein
MSFPGERGKEGGGESSTVANAEKTRVEGKAKARAPTTAAMAAAATTCATTIALTAATMAEATTAETAADTGATTSATTAAAAAAGDCGGSSLRRGPRAMRRRERRSGAATSVVGRQQRWYSSVGASPTAKAVPRRNDVVGNAAAVHVGGATSMTSAARQCISVCGIGDTAVGLCQKRRRRDRPGGTETMAAVTTTEAAMTAVTALAATSQRWPHSGEAFAVMRRHWQRQRCGVGCSDRIVSVVVASKEQSETEKVEEKGKMETREEKSAEKKVGER